MAFARLVEGRVESRGVAEQLFYRRGGGRFVAREAALRTRPKRSSGLAALGEVYLTAPAVEGDLGAGRGTARGGVRLDSTRGDRVRTPHIDYDGPADQLRTDAEVLASGPGYDVRSRGLVARADGTDVRFTDGVSGRLSQPAGASR